MRGCSHWLDIPVFAVGWNPYGWGSLPIACCWSADSLLWAGRAWFLGSARLWCEVIVHGPVRERSCPLFLAAYDNPLGCRWDGPPLCIVGSSFVSLHEWLAFSLQGWVASAWLRYCSWMSCCPLACFFVLLGLKSRWALCWLRWLAVIIDFGLSFMWLFFGHLYLVRACTDWNAGSHVSIGHHCWLTAAW